MRSRRVAILSVCAAAGLFLPATAGTSSCAAGEPARELCCNRIDDDQDGMVDFRDADCASHPECEPQRFHRGDARISGRLDITDAIQILGFLFGGSSLSCLEAGDVDDDGQVLVTDAILLLGYLFSNGPPPAAPGPPGEDCGLDPEGSPSLGCSTYSACTI